MSGADFYTNYNEQIEKLKDLRQSRLFKPIMITVRAKLDSNNFSQAENFKPTIKYTAMNASEYSLPAAISHLTRVLSDYNKLDNKPGSKSTLKL